MQIYTKITTFATKLKRNAIDETKYYTCNGLSVCDNRRFCTKG